MKYKGHILERTNENTTLSQCCFNGFNQERRVNYWSINGHIIPDSICFKVVSLPKARRAVNEYIIPGKIILTDKGWVKA